MTGAPGANDAGDTDHLVAPLLVRTLSRRDEPAFIFFIAWFCSWIAA